jgi:crotonobetainyl-CoA:carnitine CoA-transferase CaiB-like acyl-CoA transferase
MAEAEGVDLLFVPAVDEMYPTPVVTTVSVAQVSEPLEGAARPGHFAGVATVVAKLFAIVGPCHTYFGEKDFQQLAVVRRMVQDLSIPVEVVGCPTVREPDGLALSSRNAYLTRDGRWVAISASATSIATRVLRLVGRPDIAEQPWFSSAGERVAHGDEIDGAVAGWIRQRDFDEVVAAFEEAGAALAPIYDVEQLVNDPQVRARDAITTVADPDLGPPLMQNVMFRLGQTPGRIRFAGRGLGWDTEDVYGTLLGLDPESITRLREEGVI